MRSGYLQRVFEADKRISVIIRTEIATAKRFSAKAQTAAIRVGNWAAAKGIRFPKAHRPVNGQQNTEQSQILRKLQKHANRINEIKAAAGSPAAALISR